MIYKNVLFHNVAEIIENSDGSVSWKRVPSKVYSAMEKSAADSVVCDSTGVELRFVLKGESAVIKMSAYDAPKSSCSFHIYRGGIQGGWQDHEVHKLVTALPQDYVIERSQNAEHLKIMSENCGYDWDSEVIRIIFDRGKYKIYDIIGDIEPPKPEQCPKKTLLAYGSSITHGSNSIDMSHSWVSILAHNLNMDARNLGMSGSCALEPEMAEYIALEGEKGHWDIAVLELGINVLGWDEEKIVSRVSNIITQVASRNSDKPVFVISPFYHCGETFGSSTATEKWRTVIEQTVKKLSYPNVWYFNGLEILDNMSYISADEVHPNIYGVQRIADMLTTRISSILKL